MKAIYSLLFCAVVASSSLAYGDAIVSGTVSNTTPYPNSVATSASASGSSISISAGAINSPTEGYASLNGTVGPAAGSVTVMTQSVEDPPLSGFTSIEMAGFSLDVNGTYMLTGGNGYGFANWSVSGFRHGLLGGGNWGSCSITVAGITDNCDLNAVAPVSGTQSVSGTFYVPYNTPLQLSFDTSFNGVDEFTDGIDSGLTYSFGLSPVPEPMSLLLLAMGIISLPAALRFSRRTIAAD